MAIEIRQLSIKSNVVQRATGDETPEEGGQDERAPDSGTRLDEASRNELLAECRAMVLDLMARARER